MAFLVGACVGDGNLADNNGTVNSAMRLCVSNQAVRDKIDLILSSVGSHKIAWHDNKGKDTSYLGSFSTIGVRYVDSLGKRAENKFIPEELLSLSEDVLWSLLDGLLSTDGNVSRNRYEFTTTSKKLIGQLEFIAMRLGLQYNVRSRDRHPSNFKRNHIVNVLQFNARSSQLIHITNTSRQIKRSLEIPIEQTRHDFSIIRRLITSQVARGLTGREPAFGQWDRKLKADHLEVIRADLPTVYNKMKNIYSMEVKDISAVQYDGFVYDISVQDNENFVLHNGIVAHNTVFSSVQLSPSIPKLWRDIPIVAKGKLWDGKQAPLRTYGEFEREVRLGFKAMMDVMLEGDAWGKPFNFPKPEISIEPEFMEEDEAFNVAHPELPTLKELYRKSFELAAKFGTPYFDNQLPAYRNAGDGISCYQCCAYQFSSTPAQDVSFNDKLMFKDGAHFSMGSWMVLSLNCPRAAYKADHDDEKLFVELKKLMYHATEVFRIKRRWMDKLIARNRIPFASQHPKDPNTSIAGAIAVDFEALVYTIGIIGLNEAIQYHTGKQIHESPEAYKLAIRTMFELKQYARKLEQENGITLALARTPAETTAQRFAVSDLLHTEYADQAKSVIKGDLAAAERDIHKTRDLPIYYTNGTHVSVGADISLPERIKLEQTFFPIVDGGNIMHIWLGEGNPDPEGLQELAMHIAKNTQTGYFAFTRDMTVCTHEGYVTSGLLENCPRCGSDEVQHLSRITGYLQSVEGWNKGKRQELKDRKRYDIR